MAGFNLGDYITVNERIIEFYKRYPDGVLRAEILEMDETHVIMRAFAYRTPEDQLPSIGHAHETNVGNNVINKTSMLENAETSAWGRALAALGLEVSKAIASREEVENAKRREAEMSGSPVDTAPADMTLFNSIAELHKDLKCTTNKDKKAMLKEAGLGESFTVLKEEDLEKYKEFLQSKLQGQPGNDEEVPEGLDYNE